MLLVKSQTSNEAESDIPSSLFKSELTPLMLVLRPDATGFGAGNNKDILGLSSELPFVNVKLPVIVIPLNKPHDATYKFDNAWVPASVNNVPKLLPFMVKLFNVIKPVALPVSLN